MASAHPRRVSAESLANLAKGKPFPPGVSGNPGGKSKSPGVNALVDLVLESLGQEDKLAEIRQTIKAMPGQKIIDTLLFPLILKMSARLEISAGGESLTRLCEAITTALGERPEP